MSGDNGVMRAAVAWVLLVLAGCGIETTYAICGDVLCPGGTECLEPLHTCVLPGQLESCESVVEGDPCLFGAIAGRCRSGACIPEGCGNGVVETGEACDDGNRRDLDGCASDCRSDESCGNGVIDRAHGEDCDCGSSDATKPLGCAMANSDDVAAECSPDCHGRCGDGIVRGFEQCDGTDLASFTCSELGFYTGTLACSPTCRLDATSCAGRCGDDTINGPELCDGGPPPGECVAAGWDAGEAACLAGCNVDATYCTRFGWQSVEGSPARAWGNAQGTLVVLTPQASFRGLDGVRRDVGGNYTAATGYGTNAYALGGASLATWNGASWSTTATPSGFSAATDAWADATTVWASNYSTTLYVWNGSNWATTTAAPGAFPFLGLSGSSTRVCGFTVGGVHCVTRGGPWVWTSLGLPQAGVKIEDIAVTDTAVWVASEQGLWRYSGSWTRFDAASTVAVVVPPAGGVIARGQANVRWYADGTNNQVWRGLGSLAPAGFSFSAAYSLAIGDNDLVASGPDGAQRLRTTFWGTTAASNPRSIYVAPGGQRVYLGPGISDDGLTYDELPVQFQRGIAIEMYEGPIAGVFLEGGVLRAATADGLYYNAGSPYWTEPPLDTNKYVTMSVSTNTQVLLATQDTTGYLVEGILFSQTERPVALGIDTSGALYAAAGTHVDRYAGSGWTTMLTTTESIADLWVSPEGDIVAIAGSTIYQQRDGAWLSPVTLPVALTSVTGHGDDVFVAGAASGVWTGVAWFDGTRWTPVRLPAIPATPIADIAVTETSLIYIQSDKIHELARLAPWDRP